MATSQNEFSFFTGPYRFTDPVRYFTSTDPYYWEVDNIPLKQLQENDLWLKDQIEQGFKNFRVSFDRQDFNELKPYSDGEDNVVKVKPGLFSSRINYVDTNNRLQAITRLMGEVFDDPNKWRFATLADATVKSNVDDITGTDGDQAPYLNGLIERNFTWMVRDLYSVFPDRASAGNFTIQSPLHSIFFWPQASYTNNEWVSDESKTRPDLGFRRSPILENVITKFWRGVFRLAIVDVPEELSIEIPPFLASDFDYLDEDGNLQTQEAELRVDLLFLYAKPVDTSGVKVRGNTATTTRTLTSPQLGLIRGAGVVLRKTGSNAGNFGSENSTLSLDSEGNFKILASPADSSGVNNGFASREVKATFPAPDDLINVAPLILDSLQASDHRLVGQTGLPIAYIVVRKEASLNEFGETVITNSDIIDIRPFFRTAELTYNERAGLAAAFPQASIANPVVTDLRLKNVSIEIGKEVDAVEVRTRSFVQDSILRRARIVGGGIIQGGGKFGPEGAIRDLLSRQGFTTSQASYDEFRRIHNYPTQSATPFRPDWDVAPWVPATAQKDYPNDCVHLHVHNLTAGATPNELFDYVGKCSTTYNGGKLEQMMTPTAIFYCKKTVRLDRSQVDWMDHYSVDAHLVNCVPLSHQSQLSDFEGYGKTQTYAGASNIWIEYGYDKFTIYCAWVGMQNIFLNDGPMNKAVERRHALTTATLRRWGDYFDDPNQEYGYGRIPNSTQTKYAEITTNNGLLGVRDDPYVTAGFTVITEGLSVKNALNLQTAGICIYPTIKFTVTGFPGNWNGLARNMNNSSATITLR